MLQMAHSPLVQDLSDVVSLFHDMDELEDLDPLMNQMRQSARQCLGALQRGAVAPLSLSWSMLLWLDCGKQPFSEKVLFLGFFPLCPDIFLWRMINESCTHQYPWEQALQNRAAHGIPFDIVCLNGC